MIKESKIHKIGLRELAHNTKSIRGQLERGQVFALFANGTEIGKITPTKKKQFKYTKQDFMDSIVGSIKDKPGLTNEEIDNLIYDK